MQVLSGSAAATLALAACGRAHFDARADGGTDTAPRTITLGENTTSDIPGMTSDAYINACSPDLNRGAATHMHVQDGACPTTPPQVGLLRFELSGVPATTVVTSATLRISVYNNNPQTAPHTLYRVLESWVEGTGDDNGMLGGVTWNERDTGVAWTTPGCGPGSCDTQPLGTWTPSGSSAVPSDVVLDVTTVQGWIDGSLANHGFAIKTGPISPNSALASRNWNDGERPALVLTVQ